MTTPKVYLSKSKAGNINDLYKVKNQLGKYDVEITEFNGGQYNDSILINSDVLLILPHTIPGDSDLPIELGRGQYEEFITARSLRKFNKNIHFVTYVNDDVMYVDSVDTFGVCNLDWKTKYAVAHLKNEREPLFDANESVKFINKFTLRESAKEDDCKHSHVKHHLAAHTLIKNGYYGLK